MNKRIAVIGGTRFDTGTGCDLVKKNQMEGQGYALANSPEEQNKLQNFDVSKLTHLVKEKIQAAEENKADKILVFCNSLSVAVNMAELQELTSIEIVSPIQIYRKLAEEYNSLFLITANGQCLSGAERVMLKKNPKMELYGFSCLKFISEIEQKASGGETFCSLHFDKVFELSEILSVQCVVSACTHLTPLNRILNNRSKLPVIDVGIKLIETLKNF